MEITFKNKVTESKLRIENVISILCVPKTMFMIHYTDDKINKWIELSKSIYELSYITNFSN